MNVNSLAKSFLAVCSRWYVGRKFDELRIGADSQVYFWRMRAPFGGHLRVGDKARVETCVTFERAEARLIVGSRSYVGGGVISCASSICVGDDVMIAWGTTIFDHGSHSLRFSARSRDVANWMHGDKDWSDVSMAPVRIGNKAWIGFGTILLPGVNIGEGAVIGAGSVVTRDIPPWSVAAGNPARVIRELQENER